MRNDWKITRVVCWIFPEPWTYFGYNLPSLSWFWRSQLSHHAFCIPVKLLIWYAVIFDDKEVDPFLQILLTKYICVKVRPRHCLSTSAESFNASVFWNNNNKLDHFTSIERNILVPREIRYRAVLFSIVFSFSPFPWEKSTFPLWGAFFKKSRFSECLILIWVMSVDGRLIPRKKMLFQRNEKGVCSRRLGYVWTRLMFLISFIIILSGWVHRVHSTSTTYLLRRGQKVYILSGVLNF